MTEQEKREKVIKGLTNCIYAEGTTCPENCIMKDDEWKENGWAACRAFLESTVEVPLSLLDDALALLKAQEPVEPILKREGRNKYYNNYVCPVCDQELVYEQNYCSECGRAVKWE